VGFLVGFVGLYYRKWAFLKTPGCFFWLSPVTSTLKIIIDLYVIFWVKF